MRKFACLIAIALLAACGGDDASGGGGGNGGGEGGSGGTGGGGGGGGNEPPVSPLTVVNELDRVYLGSGVAISVEVPGKNQTAFVRAKLVAREDRDRDGVADGDGAAWELDVTFPGSQLEQGEVWVSAFFPEPPELLGRGMVSLELTEESKVFASATDSVRLHLESGRLTGAVESSKPEIAATIDADFTLSCKVLEGGQWVNDTEFVSEECQPYAHLIGG